MAYSFENKHAYNFDRHTMQNLHLDCLSVILRDVSDNEAARQPDETLMLYTIFEENAEAFTPYETLCIISDLLKKGRATFEVAEGQKFELLLDGIIARETEQWDFEEVTLD